MQNQLSPHTLEERPRQGHNTLIWASLSRRQRSNQSKGKIMTGTEPSGRRRDPSYRIQPRDVPIIKRRIQRGDFLNRIAADYDVNPGRISEIKTGHKFADIPAAS